MEVAQQPSLFLTAREKKAILESRDPVVLRFRHALRLRVFERLATPGLRAESPALGWWYPCAEYLSDAAMQYALQPDEALAAWLRSTSLHIARLPVTEWVGPWFRSHAEPFTGHLETAHVCWGISAVLALAGEVFTESEWHEVRQSLSDKGLTLCERWLSQNAHLANWRGIMVSGAVVAAAALNDTDSLFQLLPELKRMRQAFQPDGSYGESLQYGNYLANALMLAYEALVRSYPDYARQLEVSAYGRGMAWMAQSMLYCKPMAGWGDEPRARAINFNDSAALFRPSGDLLLHVAARYDNAVQAGMARWLFSQYYEPCPAQGPHDLATFGMRNDWGFLTLPLLTQAAKSHSPQSADLALTTGFSNGNTFVRDRWEGRSVLAIQGGNNDGVYAPGHLQGDLNSFMLVFNKERLLVDPGHSCYRNLIHGLESASQTHNTCTFLLEQDSLGLQEDLGKIKLLEQRNVLNRRLIRPDGSIGPPVERGGRLVTVARQQDISLVVSEVAAAYGAPIQEFTRMWVQVGAHVTFVADRIKAAEPVRTVWNWLLNNRDGKSVVSSTQNSLTLFRHEAGLRLWHLGQASLNGPIYSYMHDAYHPEPAQPGEGKPGSGLLFRFTDTEGATELTRLHVMLADEAAELDRWRFTYDEATLSISKDGQTVNVGFDNHRLTFSLTFNETSYQINPQEIRLTPYS